MANTNNNQTNNAPEKSGADVNAELLEQLKALEAENKKLKDKKVNSVEKATTIPPQPTRSVVIPGSAKSKTKVANITINGKVKELKFGVALKLTEEEILILKEKGLLPEIM